MITFGMPHSGHRALAAIMPRHMGARAHDMEHRYGEDLDEALMDVADTTLGAHAACKNSAVLVLTNRDSDACRRAEAHMQLSDSDEVTLRAAMLALDWHFQPVWYKGAAERIAGVTVPTRPLGGIFFHRTPSKLLVVSLDWTRLGDAARILEFVLECSIDRRALRMATQASDGTAAATMPA